MTLVSGKKESFSKGVKNWEKYKYLFKGNENESNYKY